MIVISISGCSGSGKTTVVNKLTCILGKDKISCLPLDSYYKNQDYLALEERVENNFDHPAAIDIDLFHQHLKQLIDGKSVQKPIYNFDSHAREKQYKIIRPKQIILVEGLHLLNYETIRNLATIKIFIDTDMDLCFVRRLQRDIKERGRSLDSVIKQYITTVKPMQDKHIFPMKKYADFIITNNSSEESAIDEIVDILKKEYNL